MDFEQFKEYIHQYMTDGYLPDEIRDAVDQAIIDDEKCWKYLENMMKLEDTLKDPKARELIDHFPLPTSSGSKDLIEKIKGLRSKMEEAKSLPGDDDEIKDIIQDKIDKMDTDNKEKKS